MNDYIRGGVVMFMGLVLCIDIGLSCAARSTAAKLREDTTVSIKDLEAKIQETLDEKKKLKRQIGHLEYLNRKFAKLEKQKP